MVQEMNDQPNQTPQQPNNSMPSTSGTQPSAREISRDRWGDLFTNVPVKRMIALYDYDPQELSPNVDAEVFHSFSY